MAAAEAASSEIEAAAAFTPPVFDIRAFAAWCPTHDSGGASRGATPQSEMSGATPVPKMRQLVAAR